ncbi:MAG: nickel pincer cofactor biosynthesis protein LarC [Candidatus Latescibacteria bacterium]|nr:nickel pincer cofactor biosynthesis protein LarC [Candidatus Latescibacterota bacterium]
MKTAYFDCLFGVSGDMILGALVSCGVPVNVLTAELKKLNIDGFELKENTVLRSGISAVHIDVLIKPQHEHRHLSHIKNIIKSSSLSDTVKSKAVRIFTRLAEAEARVHNTTPEKIHFHEVGALDAIIDVVGACIGLEYLDVEKIVSTPLRLGTGTVTCEHGVMPVPVPAVVELTKGIPVVRTSYKGELTTPTGAAIVTTLASSYQSLENFISEMAGYGSGTRESEEHPNVLRISIGTIQHSPHDDHSVLIETNIDDMNPEIFGFLSDKLLGKGAKDVYMSPIYMKKGRPGTLLSILTDEALKETMLEILFAETTTLGVRITRVSRKVLKRESKTVETEYGPVRVKVAYITGMERFAPEYEDCARIARERNIPLINVYDIVRKCASN